MVGIDGGIAEPEEQHDIWLGDVFVRYCLLATHLLHIEKERMQAVLSPQKVLENIQCHPAISNI